MSQAMPARAIAPVSRREFLNYVWAASMTLFMASTGVAAFAFAMPRYRVNEGIAELLRVQMPEPGEMPVPFNQQNFWLVHTSSGLHAHYKVCPHLGCIFGWDENARIFACPCHGSQFERDGTYRAGPAPRGLDRFPIELLDAKGKRLWYGNHGEPAPLDTTPGVASVRVHHKKRIEGPSR